MDYQDAKQLLIKYNAGECSPEEQALIENSLLEFNEHPIDIPLERFEQIKKSSFKAISRKINHRSTYKTWIALAGAAAALTIGISLWLFYPQLTMDLSIKKAAQIVPLGNQATLTFSNGQSMALADNKKGIIIHPEALAYEDGSEIKTGKVSGYQTITTPRGGEYKIVLSDGTKVWLNAATVLQYPVSFRERAERRVKLVSGEAYFEVAKDKTHPFIVSAQNQDVTVLGTKFDINTYSKALSTTLLEGSVRLNFNSISQKNLSTLTLSPGEQSVNTDEVFTKSKIDTSLMVAWKNGRIKFRNAELRSILSEAERWYGINVQYQGRVPNVQLTGGISRRSSLATLLKLLKMSEINFKLTEQSGTHTLYIESEKN